MWMTTGERYMNIGVVTLGRFLRMLAGKHPSNADVKQVVCFSSTDTNVKRNVKNKNHVVSQTNLVTK